MGVVLLRHAYLLLLLFEFDAANVANGDGGANDAHYTKRIGAGVTSSNVLPLHVNAKCVDGLLCGTKTWRVGHSTIKHTHSHRQAGGVLGVEHQIVKAKQRDNVEQYDAHRHHVHLHTVLLKRLEEARAHLQTDAIDEKYQSEVLNKVQHFGRTRIPAVGIGNAQLVVDVAYHDAGKQHKSDAQRHAAHLNLAQHYANGNDQGEQQYDVSHRVGC